MGKYPRDEDSIVPMGRSVHFICAPAMNRRAIFMNARSRGIKAGF
jgi:hypothetical protein